MHRGTYAAVEALRGDKGWNIFMERLIKATSKYKMRWERMDAVKMERKVLSVKWKWKPMEEEMHENDRGGFQVVVQGLRIAGRN